MVVVVACSIRCLSRSRDGVGFAVRSPSEDRAVIAAGVRRRLSCVEIGASIGRDTSVVSREVRRNSSTNGEYYGAVAHRAAARRRCRPKSFKLL